LFGNAEADSFPQAPQNQTHAYAMDVLARVPHNTLLEYFALMRPGDTLSGDFINLEENQDAPFTTIKREMVAVETDEVVTAYCKYELPGLVTPRCERVLTWLQGPWIRTQHTTITWSVINFGPRHIVTFTCQGVVANRIIALATPVNFKPNKVTSPTLGELLSRSPLNTIDTSTGDFVISHPGWWGWFKTKVVTQVAKKSHTFSWFNFGSCGQFILTAMYETGLTDVKYVRIPYEMASAGVKFMAGKARTYTTWEALMTHLKGLVRATNSMPSDPKLYAQALMNTCLYSFLCSMQIESDAYDYVRLMSEPIADLNASMTSMLIPKTFSERYLTRPMTIGVISAITVAGFFIKPPKSVQEKVLIAAAKPRGINFVVVCACIIAYLAYEYSLLVPKKKRLVSRRAATSFCPAKLFNSEQLGIERIIQNIQINGVPIDFDSPTDCPSTVVAFTDTVHLKNRPVVFPCQCARSLGTACAVRMNYQLPQLTDEILWEYGDCLIRLLRNQPWSNDDPNITRYRFVRNNDRIEYQELIPYAYPQNRLIDFPVISWPVWVNRFTGVKKKILVDAQKEIDDGAIITEKTEDACEAFVKKEPYPKATNEGIIKFCPRLIVSFSTYHRNKYGPLWYGYTKHLMKRFSIYKTRDRLELFEVQPGEHMYFYLTGYNADELGDWYARCLNQAYLALNHYKREYPMEDFCVVVIENDFKHFDGHASEDIKMTHAVAHKAVYARGEAMFKCKLPHINIKVTKLLGGQFFSFDSEGKWQSGHLATSVENTERTTTTVDMGVRRFVRRTGSPITTMVGVLGDDNLIFAVLLRRGVITLENCLTEASAAVGQQLDIVVHQHNDTFLEQPFPSASFCSGYFYTALYRGEHRIVWGPKITRILFKLFYCKDMNMDYEQYLSGIIIAYKKLFPLIPVLRYLWQRLSPRVEGVPSIEVDKETILLKAEGYTLDTTIYEQINLIYQHADFDLINLENYVLNTTDFGLDHPSLDIMCDVDLPVDESKIVVTPQFPGYFRNLKNFMKFILENPILSTLDLLASYLNILDPGVKKALLMANELAPQFGIVPPAEPIPFSFLQIFMAFGCLATHLPVHLLMPFKDKLTIPLFFLVLVTSDAPWFDTIVSLILPPIMEEILKTSSIGNFCIITLEASIAGQLYSSMMSPYLAYPLALAFKILQHTRAIGDGSLFAVKAPLIERIRRHFFNNLLACFLFLRPSVLVSIVQQSHVRPITWVLGVLTGPSIFLSSFLHSSGLTTAFALFVHQIMNGCRSSNLFLTKVNPFLTTIRNLLGFWSTRFSVS
jgi:hypothetical protein